MKASTFKTDKIQDAYIRQNKIGYKLGARVIDACEEIGIIKNDKTGRKLSHWKNGKKIMILKKQLYTYLIFY